MLKRLIYVFALFSAVFGIISALLYNTFHTNIYFSLMITFFTTFYHIAMRLITGYAAKHINISSKDLYEFKISQFESYFYKIIKLRKWKDKVPTYNKESFSLEHHSYTDLCRNMIISQFGHETIVLLSFVPLLFSKIFGGFIPFLITSVLAALFDLQFVFIQRFNRARICNIMRNA